MTRQANIAAQEHLAENINAGNIDVAVQSFAPNAVDHDPAPDQGPGRGGLPELLPDPRERLPRRAHRARAHGR